MAGTLTRTHVCGHTVTTAYNWMREDKAEKSGKNCPDCIQAPQVKRPTRLAYRPRFRCECASGQYGGVCTCC